MVEHSRLSYWNSAICTNLHDESICRNTWKEVILRRLNWFLFLWQDIRIYSRFDLFPKIELKFIFKANTEIVYLLTFILYRTYCNLAIFKSGESSSYLCIIIKLKVMKVLCIDNSSPIDRDLIRPEDLISIGEIYSVEAVLENPKGMFYHLKERPGIKGRRVQYSIWRFIPLNVYSTAENSRDEWRMVGEEDLKIICI